MSQSDLLERLHSYAPELRELQKRALKCLVAFVVVCIPMLVFSRELYGLVCESLLRHLPSNAMLIATQVATPFTIPIKLSCFFSILFLIPFFLYHIWAFIAPGLYKREKNTLL